jgi:transposase-like protein
VTTKSDTKAARVLTRPAPADTLLLATPDPRLRRLAKALGPEAGARTYVEELRWPDGVVCPRCAGSRTGWLEARAKHYCRDCGYQFRVTAGTVFHDSHLSLASWLVAIQLILESDRGFPATRLSQVLGGSYKSAWFLGHRIRSAMSHSLVEAGVPVALAREDEDADGAGSPGVSDGEGTAADGWALVRKLVAGAYRRPSADHLTAYWNEARWRAANIDDEHVFRRTVVALLDADPLQYRRLVDHGRGRPLAAAAR